MRHEKKEGREAAPYLLHGVMQCAGVLNDMPKEQGDERREAIEA